MFILIQVGPEKVTMKTSAETKRSLNLWSAKFSKFCQSRKIFEQH